VRDILLPVLMQRIYKSKTPPASTAGSRHRAPRQGHRHGPVADRAHAALEPGDVHRRVRLDPQAVRLDQRGQGARLPAGPVPFNVKGGRCEACAGDGTIKIEMHFLPDVYVPCEVCKGARYNRDTLDIEFKGKNIADVLDMPVAEAVEFFANQPSIIRYMETLMDVGLGYVRPRPAGADAVGRRGQRVKLATELAKRSTGHTIYLLDEPTTGLHFDDVRRLLTVLSRLVDQGNTVLVIEHNLDVIKTADWIIDLGPRAAAAAARSSPRAPRGVAHVDASHTGRYLRPPRLRVVPNCSASCVLVVGGYLRCGGAAELVEAALLVGDVRPS
jgi:excinuclease ABC subunit A